jgi:hypothetical protein
MTDRFSCGLWRESDQVTTQHAPELLRPELIKIAADLNRADAAENSKFEASFAGAFEGAVLGSLAPTSKPPMIPDYCLNDPTYAIM